MARAANAGIHVVLATGRRYSHALPLVEPLGIDVPLVTASGALVKDPIDHRTLYQARFRAAADCSMPWRIVDRCGYDPVVCADTFSDGFDFYHASPETRTPELAHYLAMNRGRGRLWPELLEEPPPGVFGGFVVGTLEQMLQLEGVLQRELPGKLHTHVLHPPHYAGFFIEIAPAGRDEVVGHPAPGRRMGDRRCRRSAR